MTSTKDGHGVAFDQKTCVFVKADAERSRKELAGGEQAIKPGTRQEMSVDNDVGQQAQTFADCELTFAQQLVVHATSDDVKADCCSASGSTADQAAIRVKAAQCPCTIFTQAGDQIALVTTGHVDAGDVVVDNQRLAGHRESDAGDALLTQVLVEVLADFNRNGAGVGNDQNVGSFATGQLDEFCQAALGFTANDKSLPVAWRGRPGLPVFFFIEAP